MEAKAVAASRMNSAGMVDGSRCLFMDAASHDPSRGS